MNANVSESGSLMGKMAAIFVVVLFVFSSFSLLASADSGDEQETELPTGITLGEALVPSDEGVEVISELNTIYPGQEVPVTTVMDTGKFSPAKAAPGDAKILVVDDDGENWMSGPWIEASHVATALNDGGYSYDVFRAGRWGGTNMEIPSGDAGLGILDDYEAIIWYSGWNTNIMTSSETSVLSRYLDFECGDVDAKCTDNRNMIVLTQMSDWFDANSGQFQNNYMHSDTYYSSYIVVGGTSNPMKGVEDSIFEGTEYSTDTAGVHYLDRPCGNKPFDDSAVGAFYMDAHKDATHGHKYHAIQYPREGIPGFDYDNEHKAFMFADEIGVFDKRTDRADFMGTILGWMDVTKEATQNVDMGIGGVDIPNHVQYWRSVEANVELDIRITVTNYGLLPQGSTAVHLKLKNEFGQILFDSTFDTRAFPENHPMHVADSIQSGDSIVFTFNKTNDYHQRIFDQVDENKARAVIFTSAGMNKMIMEVKHTGDQGLANNYVQADVGVGKWIENGEAPEDEIGPSITFGDTDDNGANSLPYPNYHRATSYDTDGDGCGWAVTTDTDGDGVPDCVDDGHTLNKTESAVFHEGKSSLAAFNTNGWYKTSSDGECTWGSNSLSDSGCPKFTPEPNQDDYFVSPPLDLSAMDEVVVGMLFSGCMESGDYFRMQISKDEGASWTNLINYSGFCPGEGSWYLWGGGNPKYQGYVLGSDYFGTDDADKILFRIQQDSDNDQNTEGSRPYMGWFIDEIVFRGTERITRDVAIGDITVDEDFIVKNQGGNSLWREINATVINAGESGWTDLPVKMSITNLQGDDLTGDLDKSDFALPTLAGASSYGDVRQGQENEDQTDLFALFRCPTANTYYITAEVIVPGARDFFPWNNSMTITFRVFDTFFKDNVDSSGTGNDGLQRSDVYTYTTVQRTSSGDNTWKVRDIDNNAYDNSEYVWQYAKENGYDKNNPTTSAGGDDSLITQDTYDRDGDSGTKFDADVNVDLRAAFKPMLSFAIKWDLGSINSGDRLEVRASSDFDSSTKLTSGTWSVIKTYRGDCGCPFLAAEDDTWIIEELDLTEFEGYQTWIDFRVVTAAGGGKGVMLDNIMVVGNEYRNNLDIIDVTTERFSASGLVHDLSVTVKGIGLVDQNLVSVSAKIIDTNTGVTVWEPSVYAIPVALSKGDEYTVSPDLPDGAGNSWRWGAGLEPGIYSLEVEANRNDAQTVLDENPANNKKKYTIVLGAALLAGHEWGTGDNMGDGWSSGSYIWDGTDDGSLVSDSFTIWNKKPFLVVEAEYHLTEATVKAEVSVGSSGAWHPVKWRAADQSSTLYSIPKENYAELPGEWTGSSFFDNSTTQTFYADLGAVDNLGDGSGNIQDQFIGGTMQVRIVASTTCTGGTVQNPCSGGTFTAFYPAVFGLHDYAVDVKEVNPETQNAIPSSLTGGMVTKTYTVKSNNFGAASDVPIVDFVISAPQDSEVVLDDGTEAVLDSVLQQGGGSTSTVVAIKPGTLCWGNLVNDVCVDDKGRDSPDGGDNTAYVAQDGTITWPSGETSTNAAPGWIINNPTKASWDNIAGEPTGNGLTMTAPGDVSITDIILQVGFASWAPPGTYSIQADARSLADYGNTFTSGDPEGQASMKIAKPDLSIGDNVRYTSHATGFGESGSGWVKQSGCENNPTPQEPCVTDEYFSFMFEIVNSGTETVGTFKVGLEDFEGNPLGVQVGVYWSGNGWKIDELMSNAHDAQIIDKKFISFKATSADLGMSAGPGGDVSGAYTFYLSVDVTGAVSESNENNNKVLITVTAVKEVNTVPSFNMSLAAMTLSGLLAAVGIALRQKEEE